MSERGEAVGPTLADAKRIGLQAENDGENYDYGYVHGQRPPRTFLD